MTGLDVEVFEQLDDAEPLWREVSAKADLHIYQTFDWLSGWFRFVGEPAGVRACLIALRDRDGQPLMLLPLAIERRGLWTRLVWMGAEFFDYHTPILMPGAEKRLAAMGLDTVWRTIIDALPSVDYADFERQLEFVGNQANPLAGYKSTLCFHGAHHTKLFGDWPAYYASKRGGRRRRNDRRKRERLEDKGALRFLIAEDPSDIARLTAAMIEQKEAYADIRAKRCLLTQPGYTAFFQSLTERGVEDGSVLLCGLELNGEILAVRWGGRHRGRFYCIVTSYADGDLSRLSPGDMLLHDMMRWCFDNGIDTYDFTYGDEPYKEAWCEHNVALYRSLLPITAWGTVRVVVLLYLLQLKRWAKGKSWLVAAHTWSRKRIWSIRSSLTY